MNARSNQQLSAMTTARSIRIRTGRAAPLKYAARYITVDIRQAKRQGA